LQSFRGVLQNPLPAKREKAEVVSGGPDVVKRGDDGHPAVSSVGLPVLQVVLPEACLHSHEGIFPPSGQLQPVCGADGACADTFTLIYARIQAGEVQRHQFY
jgi:hypothetical protein